MFIVVALALVSTSYAQTLGDIINGAQTFLANANVTTLQAFDKILKTQGNLFIGSGGEVKTTKELNLAPNSKVTVAQDGKVTTEGLAVDSGIATIEGGLLNFGSAALGVIAKGATLVLNGTASFKGAISTAAESTVLLRGEQKCDSSTKVKGDGLLSVQGSLTAEGSALISLGEKGRTKCSLAPAAVINAVSAVIQFAAAVQIEAAAAGQPGCQCKGSQGIQFDDGCTMVDSSKITVSEESKCVVTQGPVAVKPDCSAIVTGGGKFQVEASASIDVQANANITFETPCELKAGASFNIAAGASAYLKAATSIIANAAAKAYFKLQGNASLVIGGPFTCDNKCGVQGDQAASVVTFAHTPAVSATTTVVVSDAAMECKTVKAMESTKLDFNGTVSLAASLEVSGSAVVAVNPGVMTCKQEVKCSGGSLTVKPQSVLTVEAALHVEASAKVEIQQSSNVTAKTCNCGQQAAMPATKAQLIVGGQLTVTGGVNLDASKCDVQAENAEIVVAGTMTSEIDLRSELKAGEYKVKQLSCRGKSWVRNTGDAVLKGSVRVQAEAHFEAMAAFSATAALMVEDTAKVTTSGDHSFGCNEAKFGEKSKFVAKYNKVAASAAAALVVTAKASFSGTVEIQTNAALKKGDKYVIAKYGSMEGKFANIEASGNGRKRDANDWTIEYGANEAVATYNGEDQTAVPTTVTTLSTTAPADSAATLTVGVAALVASLALAL